MHVAVEPVDVVGARQRLARFCAGRTDLHHLAAPLENGLSVLVKERIRQGEPMLHLLRRLFGKQLDNDRVVVGEPVAIRRAARASGRKRCKRRKFYEVCEPNVRLARAGHER